MESQTEVGADLTSTEEVEEAEVVEVKKEEQVIDMTTMISASILDPLVPAGIAFPPKNDAI